MRRSIARRVPASGSDSTKAAWPQALGALTRSKTAAALAALALRLPNVARRRINLLCSVVGARTARISADAAAGEVLLSQDTLDAAGGELDGVALLAGFGYSRRQVVCERCGSAPTLGERGLQA